LGASAQRAGVVGVVAEKDVGVRGGDGLLERWIVEKNLTLKTTICLRIQYLSVNR
jgi:hypothetical protein